MFNKHSIPQGDIREGLNRKCKVRKTVLILRHHDSSSSDESIKARPNQKRTPMIEEVEDMFGSDSSDDDSEEELEDTPKGSTSNFIETEAEEASISHDSGSDFVEGDSGDETIIYVNSGSFECFESTVGSGISTQNKLAGFKELLNIASGENFIDQLNEACNNPNGYCANSIMKKMTPVLILLNKDNNMPSTNRESYDGSIESNSSSM
jgi:hypothetical protein